MSEDVLAQVRRVVEAEPARDDDEPQVGGRLRRLCRAAAVALPAAGVGLSVMASDGAQVLAVASDDVHQQVEELQLVLGEGPCLDSRRLRRPVLTADLDLAARTRWPGWTPAACDLGVAAAFAFPLQVGAAHLGALDVYQSRPGPLALDVLGRALVFADVAMGELLDAQDDVRPGDRDDLGADALEPTLELYQAQGMVMIQLGVGLEDAMARLRAHSFAQGRRLGDVAADVVSRRLVFERDDR